jgi:hypothetical protein
MVLLVWINVLGSTAPNAFAAFVRGSAAGAHFAKALRRPFFVEERAECVWCVYRKLNPKVLMMKPAQDGVRNYGAGSLNRPRIRRIFV